DIAKMPHLLVAGSTGAGKSVCVNALIVSLLYKASPEELKLILIDPKKVEFPPYNGIPHLLVPVITDAAKAAGTLEWAVLEMEKRYALLSAGGKRDIEGYNAACRDNPDQPRMNRIVIIVDEMADLLMESKKEKNTEHFIVRIAQKARACGIHLVLATQRPDAKVITGLIKANVPSRIALKVAGAVNSRIVLDRPGAERLIGHGDMLFAPAGVGNPVRIQGCYVDERDIQKIVTHIRKHAEASYAEDVMEQIDRNQMRAGGIPAADDPEAEEDLDPMLPAAIEVILDSGQGSVSFLQRRLKLGYARAARLMDLMEQRGIVGPFEGSKPRKVLVTREQWDAMDG
ncbi:MAG: DNA translocase FtsK, partial [Oscillospiraceae bacterium]|nr:DNA translocase FtsK [Oscillospiraceae bacterium]